MAARCRKSDPIIRGQKDRGSDIDWSERESATKVTRREGKDATAMVDESRKALFTLPQREKL